MAKTKTTLVLKVTNQQTFIDYLKRFKPVGEMLLLEIDEHQLSARQATPEHTTLKGASIPLPTVFEGDVQEGVFRLGIFNIVKLIDSFGHFSPTDIIKFEVDYYELSDNVYVGTKIALSTSSVQINQPCADLALLTDISEKVVASIVNQIETNQLGKFTISRDEFTKLQKLSSKLNDKDDAITLKVENGNVTFECNAFTMKLNTDKSVGEDAEMSLNSQKLNHADPDRSEIIFAEDKVLVRSLENNTLVILGGIS